jgi:hypothetical protein
MHACIPIDFELTEPFSMEGYVNLLTGPKSITSGCVFVAAQIRVLSRMQAYTAEKPDRFEGRRISNPFLGDLTS